MLRYSTFPNVKDTQSRMVESSWDDFVDRLSSFVVTDDKRSVELFCACIFKGSGRRGNVTSDEASMLILDVDNAVEATDDQGTKTKVKVDNPLEIDVAKAILEASGLEFVLATTHSHTVGWPKFRIVIPLDAAVPASKWLQFTENVLEQVNLDAFSEAIDPCYKTVAQIYYWPSHGPDAVATFFRGHGTPLKPTYSIMPAARRERENKAPTTAMTEFTEAQIYRYYSTVLPDLDWSLGGGVEWKNPCPLHKGNKVNFYVNQQSGLWKCFSSNCNPETADGTDAGNVYQFHARYKGMSVTDARPLVHDIMGGEPGAAVTTEELDAIIRMGSAELIPYIYEQLAKQPPSARKSLQDLVTEVFPAITKREVRDNVAEHRKVVRLRPEAGGGEPITLDYDTNAYGLKLDPKRYLMDPSGVYAVRRDREGNFVREMPPVTDRPIWIETLGLDYATDRTWAKLVWEGSEPEARRRHEAWLPAEAISSKETLLGLDDGPVSLDNVLRVSGFLRYVKTVLSNDPIPVTSKIGWVEKGGEPVRFVGTRDETYAYIGPEIVVKGSVDDWSRGMQALIDAGERGFKGLACLGLAAAAPFVRLLGRRRPVLGLIAESGKGKGMVLNYALSMWSKPQLVPVGSTFRGIQDRNVLSPDYPMVLDEIQQLHKMDPTALENLMYFLGNAQRRITSSKSQEHKGGDQLYGVCMFACEFDVIPSMERGAQNRVVGLYGEPLDDEDASNVVQRCTQRNWGVVGAELTRIVNDRFDAEVTIIESYADHVSRTTPSLRGDDRYTLALVQRGIELLAEVTGLPVRAGDVRRWLGDVVSGVRGDTRDSIESAFAFVMDTIISSEWDNAGTKNILFDLGQVVAWRLDQAIDPANNPLEVNFSSKRVVDLLKLKHQNERIVREWISRGWVRPQSKNTYWIRPLGRDTGSGAKVWRITTNGLRILGYTPKFGPLEDEDVPPCPTT